MELTATSSTPRFSPSPGTRPANAGRRFHPEPLTRAEVGALLAACSSSSRNGIRNRALITVMARAGLRVGEALALKPADVDCAAGSIRVLRGKGGRARTAGLPPDAAAVVAAWLDVCPPGGLLFTTSAGGALSPNYVRNLLTRLALRAGISKRVHPHGLRHTMASDMAGAGVPVNLISSQLGHVSSSVTARYIDHIAAPAVVARMRGLSWG